MSIQVRVHNQSGEWIEMDRACFGFLAYINQWDEDDVEDFSAKSHPRGWEGLKGFSSDELRSVDYLVSTREEVMEKVLKAIEGLPQYYKNVTIKDEGYGDAEFNIPLDGGVCMQIPPIAGMMLRNIFNYDAYRNTFMKLIEKDVDPTHAFVFAQAYPFRVNALNKDLQGMYRAFGGDETIFPADARLCDIIHMIKGGIGDAWQGPYGDTPEGYGRYGNYNGDTAPKSNRTGYAKSLADLTLVTDPEVYKESGSLNEPLLDSGVMEANKRVFIPLNEFINDFYPKFLELLK